MELFLNSAWQDWWKNFWHSKAHRAMFVTFSSMATGAPTARCSSFFDDMVATVVPPPPRPRECLSPAEIDALFAATSERRAQLLTLLRKSVALDEPLTTGRPAP